MKNLRFDGITVQVDEEAKVEPRARFQPILEEPEGTVRLEVCRVVSSTGLDMGIAALILGNVLVMAFESFKPAAWQVGFNKIGGAQLIKTAVHC